IPEFAQGGKEGISIRHLLTHMGSLRTAEKCDLGASWQEIIDCICGSSPEPRRAPGERAAYHASSSWYVLGEIVRRIDGRSLCTYAKEQIFALCGMTSSWMALSKQEFASLGDRLAVIYHTEKQPISPHHRWNSESDAAVCRPGRNGRGPIGDLG